MNKPIYLYADKASRSILQDGSEKLLFIGGDFSGGNFGDILQHLNSLSIAKKIERFSTVSVMAANAIGFKSFPEWARSAYGTDAIIFISEYPLILQDGDPDLALVQIIQNVSVVLLYGGGFLNYKWGDFCLEVTEYFLRSFPGVTYLVSGQQITHQYEKRVLKHIQDFEPAIFGVRDEMSNHLLKQLGFQPEFSFDDATEALVTLSQKVGLRHSVGLLLHLNTSDYTADDTSTTVIRDDLARLSGHVSVKHGVTLLQAFMDPRHEVKDTRESIKLIDSAFPFMDYRIVELAPLAYRCFEDNLNVSLSGEIGCSSSYHVALWLQLANIPCWLRSRNAYYDQKSKALQVHQDLESFLKRPFLANHSLNLERRGAWLERLSSNLMQAPAVNKGNTFNFNLSNIQSSNFYFKGLPTLEEKNQWQIGQTKLLEIQLAETNHISHEWNPRAEATEALTQQAQEKLGILGDRIVALTTQITELGHIVHEQQRQAESAKAQASVLSGQVAELGRENTELVGRLHQMAELGRENTELASRLHQIIESRSWRLTKPLRAVLRYFKHGHFDTQGQVGLYSIAQNVGRRLPVPVRVSGGIEWLLSKFRRK